jgi:hypothetical protein
VIALASGLARNTIAPAISSAWSSRPSGMRSVAARVKVSFSKKEPPDLPQPYPFEGLRNLSL